MAEARHVLRWVAALPILVVSPSAALAAPVVGGKGGANPIDLTQDPMSGLLLLAGLALLPFAFMALTAFAKISTVLHIVRGAIGAQSVPSNAVILALSIALTLVAMTPVGTRIANGLEPLVAQPGRSASEIAPAAVSAVVEPLRGFLAANATQREKARFLALARSARPPADRAAVGESSLVVLVPAFMITELVEAFVLGFAIYLPLLVIDLVVANVLLALGMQMMTPTQVSLPFKLLLFVAIDGWGLLAQALVSGYSFG